MTARTRVSLVNRQLKKFHRIALNPLKIYAYESYDHIIVQRRQKVGEPVAHNKYRQLAPHRTAASCILFYKLVLLVKLDNVLCKVLKNVV